MSFSTDCKKEITGDPPKKPCCRRALLCGVLAARGEVNSGTVTVYADLNRYAMYTAKMP